jgi:hypothetical protein
MKLHRPLIRIIGKSVEDYVQKATCSLERRSFGEKLRAYLGAQNVAVEMNRRTTNTLFDITLKVLTEQSAASEMKKARLAQDWRAQRKMTTAVEKHLFEVKRIADANQRIASKPNTSLLAKSVLMKTNDLLRELEDVDVVQRARKSMLPVFVRSAKNTKSYVWELDAYLRHRIPWLQPKQRELVIAGTMIASGLKSDDGSKDHAANIPMARSRANFAMRGEENAVSWLDQRPVPQVVRASSPLRPANPQKRNPGK